MDNPPYVLMRPLEDLGFPGYWLSVCGHLFSEYDESWMTPIPPKKSFEYRHWELGTKVRVPRFYREGGEPKKAKTVRLTQTSPEGARIDVRLESQDFLEDHATGRESNRLGWLRDSLSR